MTTTGSAGALGEVPDVPAAVVGWRQWRLEHVAGRPRLASPVRWARWEPGAATAARCRDADHRVPADGCGCGIYAARAIGGAAHSAAVGRAEMVIGRVALWGEILEGEHGWRAERGYPTLLIVDPQADDALVEALAADYGVPVRRSPVALSFLRAVPNAEQVRRYRAAGRRRQDAIIPVLERQRAAAESVDATTVDAFFDVTAELFRALRAASLARLPREVARITAWATVPPVAWVLAMRWAARSATERPMSVGHVVLITALIAALGLVLAGVGRGVSVLLRVLAIRWPLGVQRSSVAIGGLLVMLSVFDGMVTDALAVGDAGLGWLAFFAVVPALVGLAGLVCWREAFPSTRRPAAGADPH